MQAKEEILEALEELLPNYKFDVSSVIKRNDEEKDALVIKGPDGLVAPVIYLDEYPDATAVELADIIQRMLHDFSIRQDQFKDTLLSPEYVMDHVRLQLVSTEKNREYLQDKPSLRVGTDLSAIFYVPLEVQGQGKACLHNGIIDGMNLDVEALKTAALHNMWEAKQIRGMSELLLDMIGGEQSLECAAETERILSELEKGTMQEMVVVGNRENMEGAATILCAEFAERCNQDIVILPSSCHEVIIIPHTGDSDLREYQKMVEEINRTQVDSRDVLSDNVYVFSGKTKTMSLACDKYGLVPVCDDTKLIIGEYQAMTR